MIGCCFGSFALDPAAIFVQAMRAVQKREEPGMLSPFKPNPILAVEALSILIQNWRLKH